MNETVATKLQCLKLWRNSWMEKKVANEIDLKMIEVDNKGKKKDEIKPILDHQNLITRCQTYIDIIDEMIKEETK